MSAKDIVAEIAVNLTLDSAQFASGASAAEARAKTLEGRMGALGGRAKAVGGALTGLAGGFIAGLGVSTVTNAISSGLEYAASLGEVADQLGVSSTALQEYRYAATQTGIDQGQLESGLARLTRSLGEAATGSGPAAEAFSKLGINIRDANGHIKPTGDLLPEIAEALKRIPDPAARAAVLVDLFGKSGQKMGTLLAGGAKGVNDLRAAAHELGTVITPEQIARADEAADKWAAYKQVISSQIAVGAVTGLEGLTAFNTFMDNWAAKIAKNIADTKGEFARYGSDVATNFGTLKGTIAAGASAWDGYAQRVAANVAGLKSGIAGLATSAIASMTRMADGIRAQVGAKLDAVWTRIKEKTTQAGNDFYRLYDRVVGHSYFPDLVDEVGQHAQRFDAEMVAPISEATEAAASAFAELANDNDIGGALGGAAAQLRELEELVPRVFGGMAGDIGGGAITAIDALSGKTATLEDKFRALGEVATTIFGKLFGGKAGGVFSALLQGGLNIAGAFGAFKGAGKPLYTGVSGSLFGGARANGGPVVPGKSYLVGENGPEFVTPRRSGFVHPNGSGGGLRVQVIKGDLFDVIVDQRAGRVAAPMAGQSAVMGAQGGVQAMTRRAGRMLPR